jgi:hypothetical protein
MHCTRSALLRNFAPAIEAEWPRRGTRLGAKHESAATPEGAGAPKNVANLQQYTQRDFEKVCALGNSVKVNGGASAPPA